MNLVQDQTSVGIYYTKLKTLGEELHNFQPPCSFTNGGSKNFIDFIQYATKFLMERNDSFITIRGQALLIDPLSSIKKGLRDGDTRRETTITKLRDEHWSLCAFTIRSLAIPLTNATSCTDFHWVTRQDSATKKTLQKALALTQMEIIIQALPPCSTFPPIRSITWSICYLTRSLLQHLQATRVTSTWLLSTQVLVVTITIHVIFLDQILFGF